MTSRPSIGQITQQIQSRSRTRRSQSVVTQLEFPKRNQSRFQHHMINVSVFLLSPATRHFTLHLLYFQFFTKTNTNMFKLDDKRLELLEHLTKAFDLRQNHICICSVLFIIYDVQSLACVSLYIDSIGVTQTYIIQCTA